MSRYLKFTRRKEDKQVFTEKIMQFPYHNHPAQCIYRVHNLINRATPVHILQYYNILVINRTIQMCSYPDFIDEKWQKKNMRRPDFGKQVREDKKKYYNIIYT